MGQRIVISLLCLTATQAFPSLYMSYMDGSQVNHFRQTSSLICMLEVAMKRATLHVIMHNNGGAVHITNDNSSQNGFW